MASSAQSPAASRQQPSEDPQSNRSSTRPAQDGLVQALADSRSRATQTTNELEEARAAIDDLAAYVEKLEAALLSAPLINPREAHTTVEKRQVVRQSDWMERHADVLQRARGVPNRAIEVMKQKAIGQVKLRASQIRIMNKRVQLGDATASPVDADMALKILMEDLSKL